MSELSLYADRGFVEVHDEGKAVLRATEQSACRMLLAHAALVAALGEIQSLLYSADNADTADMKNQCVRKAFGITRDALEKARGA